MRSDPAAGLLRLARDKAGLTQVEVARRAGVPASMVSAYEHSRRQPTLPTLLRLLKAAGYENTIAVAVLGSTFDGSYEPVAAIAIALDDLASDGLIDVPIHVDAAPGGFVAPFVDPDLVWDFRIRRVASINASGHKFGLVYPGVGWVVWRDSSALPKELIFDVDYLGGQIPQVRVGSRLRRRMTFPL